MSHDLTTARSGGPMKGSATIPSTSRAIRELLELIAALDRRLPQVERAGEEAIAHDAAALKARALKRIEELERDTRGTSS